MLNIAKQREPATVKFRAARRKDDGAANMFPCGTLLGPSWEWLEPAQEFEVKV